MRGRKPPETPPRHRVKPVHDWTEVENTPYRGPWPYRMPPSYSVNQRDGSVVKRPFLEVTKRWWEAVRTMPHAVLWEKSDWMFALATLHVAEQAFHGSAAAASELRARERILGTTLDARRDLRIRYVGEGSSTVSTEQAEEEVSTLAAVIDL